MTDTPPNLLHTLTILRWVAVIGQAFTVYWVVEVLRVPFDARTLWTIIAALAVFNLWAVRRARQVRDPHPAEVLGHIGVDVVTLACLIARTGGTMNPFVSLFLLPIALVAVALSPRWVVATAVLCGAGYAAAAVFSHPLPHVHGGFGDAFDLHMLGMTVNFVVSALVLTCFVTWLAEALRKRNLELAKLREQFTRNEGILALATHAASVAHELNTPLGTLTLLLEEQGEAGEHDHEARIDVELMRSLVNACRDRVRELAAPAAGINASTRNAGDEIQHVIDSWRLLRPEIQLDRQLDLDKAGAARLDAGIGHLLQALLNNAADASARDGKPQVDLELRVDGAGKLQGAVRDYGAGFDHNAALLPGTLFRTTKPDGMGVGLALSHATVERLGGELSMEAAGGRGVIVRFSLPLAC